MSEWLEPPNLASALEKAWNSMRLSTTAAFFGIQGFRNFTSDQGAIDFAKFGLSVGWEPEAVKRGLELYIEANSQDRYAKAN